MRFGSHSIGRTPRVGVREVDHRKIPVLITCRDRLTPLVELVNWLERAGHERIYLIDNDSTYPPLLEFYEKTAHDVIRLNANLRYKAPWLGDVVRTVAAGHPYVVSDPDVVPVEECPLHAVAVFQEALLRFPRYRKAGFGLRIDDLPSSYQHRKHVQLWEQQFWRKQIEPGLFDAPIDTTFALYRAGLKFHTRPAIRTGPPYIARHLPWYADGDQPDEEERYYRHRAALERTWWAAAELRPDIVEKIERRAARHSTRLSSVLGGLRGRLGRR